MQTYVSLIGESPPPEVVARFEGVGLVRGEYIQRRFQGSMLTAEVQAALRSYMTATAERFAPGVVCYRTMDLWTDEGNSLAGSTYVDFERNPLLGIRGGRRARRAPDEFRAELDTLAEVAAAAPNLEVLFPFVGDGEEFAELLALLRAAGLTCPVGSMVEIPSAALTAESILAAGAARLLVGMNDLSCLTCGSARSTEFREKSHPAVWELIDRTVAAAHAAGAPAGMAGSLSPAIVERAERHGLDYVTLHYSQARSVLGLGDEPWPDEGMELEIKYTTKAAIDRFSADMWALRLAEVAVES